MEYEFGTLTVSPIKIKVNTASATKTYDGLEISDSGYTISSGELLEGHSFEFEFPSLAGAGTVQNLPAYKVLDSSGNDCTEKYDVQFAAGTLEIIPITLKITTRNVSKVYDANPLTDKNGWELVSGEVLAQDTLKVTHTGTQINAGSSKNTISVKVYSKDGKDVTELGYKIDVTEGTLTVDKRPATIISGSASKIYDGSPLVCKDYATTGFLSGQQPNVNITGTQVAVGSSDNKFSVLSVSDSSGYGLLSNYSITSKFGTLTVKPSNSSGNISDSGGSASPSGDAIGKENGAGGESNTNHDTTTINFPETGEEGDGPIVRISFAGKHEPEEIYLREISYGNYDGRSWGKAPSYTSNSTQSPLLFMGGTLKKSQTISAASLKIDRCGNYVSLLPNYSASLPYSVTANNDVSVQYRSDVESLMFPIYAGVEYDDVAGIGVNKTSLETKYRTFVYDNYLGVPESTRQALLAIAAENGIHKDSPTLVTDIQNYIRSAATYDMGAAHLYPNGIDDVVIYFLTEAKSGICQHFASAATLMYRVFGIPARYTGGYKAIATYGYDTDVTGEEAHAWTEIYVDGKGWVCIDATAGGGHGMGSSASGKADIIITSYSRVKEYDGQPFGEWNYDKAWISSGKLADGHRLVVTVEELGKNETNAGTTENKIVSYHIFDKNGKDVTKEYKVYCNSGESTILRREITIQSSTASKVYDGTPLKSETYWIVRGSVLPEHELQVVSYSSITKVGSASNKVSITIRDRESSMLKSSNYLITFEYGTLTILPTIGE